MQQFLASLSLDPLALVLWGWLGFNAALLLVLAVVAVVRRHEPLAPERA